MLTVISHPRSGSSYFMSRVRHFRALRVYMEVFHFDDATLVEALGQDAERVLKCVGAADLPRIGRIVRSHIVSNMDR